MNNLFVVTLLALAVTAAHNSYGIQENGTILGTSTALDYTSSARVIETKTNFTEKEVTEKVKIPFKTQYVNNPNLEAEVEKTVQEGRDGEKKDVYTLTYWQEKQIDKTLKKTETTAPRDKIIEVGTKFTWKDANFNGTTFRYWKKLNVRATSYDANCKGCTGRTWAGTEVKIGVCAVDPKVIALGTSFYVPGYGPCHAEDIGGAIKGKKIDLGFPDVSNGFWSARYVDIYLLDGEPKI